MPPGDDPGALSLWERLDTIDAELIGLTGRVGRFETGLEELRSDLDHIEANAPESAADLMAGDLAHPGPAVPGEADSGAAATPRGPNPDAVPILDMRVLVGWVRENLALVVQRKIPQNSAPHWCRQWWQHPEAILRFEALRRAWLVAVTEPGAAMANYLGQLDQHLAVLMGEHGPFAGCTGGQHRPDSSARCLDQDDPDEHYYRAVQALTAAPRPPPGP